MASSQRTWWPFCLSRVAAEAGITGKAMVGDLDHWNCLFWDSRALPFSDSSGG